MTMYTRISNKAISKFQADSDENNNYLRVCTSMWISILKLNVSSSLKLVTLRHKQGSAQYDMSVHA